PSETGQSPEVLWQNNKLSPRGYPSPLYYQGRVYAVSSQGVVLCADAADGKVLWDERVKGPIAASAVAADGKIYVVSEKGACTVLKAGGEKAAILGTNDLNDGIMATPAISNGCIYLRSDKSLYCIGEKK